MSEILNYLINIPKDFNDSPSARFIKDGKFSWEEFYNNILESYVPKLDWKKKLTIIMDWWYWYGPSFLSQAFWTFYKALNERWVNMWDVVNFISEEEPWLVDYIKYLVDVFMDKWE